MFFFGPAIFLLVFQSYASSNVSPLTANEFEGCGTNILFVVDSTGSVREFFEDHRQYLLRVISRLEVIGNEGVCIGVIVYSSQLRKKIVTSFDNCKKREEITKIVESLPFFSGITATGSALKLSQEAVGTRHSLTPTNVVVITDGFSYDDVEEPAELLQRLPNVRTFAVTVSEKWREPELQAIAGDPERVFKGMESAERLAATLSTCRKTVVKEEAFPPQVKDAFLESMDQRTNIVSASLPVTSAPIQLSYTPQHFYFNQRGEPCSCYPTCSQKTLALLRKGELQYPAGMSTPAYYTQSTYPVYPTTTYRPTTEAPITTAPSTTQTITVATPTSQPALYENDEITAYKQNINGCMLDLMIILDASGSLRERFQRQLDMIIELADRLRIGPDETRVALVKYAGPRKARLVFDFGDYTTKEALKEALRQVRFIGGTTYTNEALLKAEQELGRLNGRHNFSTAVVVVFTDGYSHEDPEIGASLLRQRGVPVYAVAINHVFPVNNKELLTIAGDQSRVFLDSDRIAFESEIERLSMNCRTK